MNIPSDKHLRRAIILTLCIATVFVIVSAFDDLYHPGSALAKKYSDIATVFLLLTVILSLPLWYKKIKAIENWLTLMDGVDSKVRWTAIWQVSKPLITTIITALVLTVIIVAIIQYYDLVPKDAIANYKAYYTPINYSNLTFYPNTTIEYP